MPTTRHRYQVTETEAVTRALDVAERHWPGVPRSKLLLRLLALGGESLAHSEAEQELARRIAIHETSGKYDDAFGANYLDDLRGDWPA